MPGTGYSAVSGPKALGDAGPHWFFSFRFFVSKTDPRKEKGDEKASEDKRRQEK